MKLFSCNHPSYKAGMTLLVALVFFALAMFGIFALADMTGIDGYNILALSGDSLVACAGVH